MIVVRLLECWNEKSYSERKIELKIWLLEHDMGGSYFRWRVSVIRMHQNSLFVPFWLHLSKLSLSKLISNRQDDIYVEKKINFEEKLIGNFKLVFVSKMFWERKTLWSSLSESVGGGLAAGWRGEIGPRPRVWGGMCLYLLNEVVSAYEKRRKRRVHPLDSSRHPLHVVYVDLCSWLS